MDRIDQLAQRLAEMYRQNRNPPSTAPRVGVITSTDPLTIQWGDRIVLTEGMLRVPRLYSTGHVIGGQIFRITLEPGMKVVLMPEENLKTWYLMDILE